VFGQILAQIGDLYAGHLPWTLVHAPAGRRTYGIQPIYRVRVSDILRMCLGCWKTAGDRISGEEALISLGQHLEELASRPQAEFDEVVRNLLCTRARTLMVQLEARRRHVASEGHECWANDLNMHVQSLDAFLRRPWSSIPIDLSETRVPNSEFAKATRGFVKEFGRLLYWWPAMIDRAKELAAEGRRLGREMK
jgi:hypothetical protein